jgi:hypothetical protein
MLSRVYRQGHHAGMTGLPCTPPAGYEGLIGLDLIGTWTAGWDAANRELQGAASPRCAAYQGTGSSFSHGNAPIPSEAAPCSLHCLTSIFDLLRVLLVALTVNTAGPVGS